MDGFENLNWIVVPGGPGLSATYLKIGFKGAFADYKLHYYDPLGSPEMKVDYAPTINELVDQIFAVAATEGCKKFGLITHSFGNYLALRALERKGHAIAAIIMVTPMSFIASNWKNALQNIEAQVPKTILQTIHELSNDKNKGAEIFKLLFPYYAAKPVKFLPLVPFNFEMCNKISAQVGNYNDIKFLLSCPIPWMQVVGEKDPFYREENLFSKQTISIPGVGHYPFFEDPIAFCKATKSISKKLSVN